MSVGFTTCQVFLGYSKLNFFSFFISNDVFVLLASSNYMVATADNIDNDNNDNNKDPE